MCATDGAFAQWPSQAQITEQRLTAEQRGLLQYVFAFRQRCGDDQERPLVFCLSRIWKFPPFRLA